MTHLTRIQFQDEILLVEDITPYPDCVILEEGVDMPCGTFGSLKVETECADIPEIDHDYTEEEAAAQCIKQAKTRLCLANDMEALEARVAQLEAIIATLTSNE